MQTSSSGCCGQALGMRASHEMSTVELLLGPRNAQSDDLYSADRA